MSLRKSFNLTMQIIALSSGVLTSASLIGGVGNAGDTYLLNNKVEMMDAMNAKYLSSKGFTDAEIAGKLDDNRQDKAELLVRIDDKKSNQKIYFNVVAYALAISTVAGAGALASRKKKDVGPVV